MPVCYRPMPDLANLIWRALAGSQAHLASGTEMGFVVEREVPLRVVSRRPG